MGDLRKDSDSERELLRFRVRVVRGERGDDGPPRSGDARDMMDGVKSRGRVVVGTRA